jgi:hypothetical protein
MPIMRIMLREGEVVKVILKSDEEVQFLVKDITTRRAEANGLIQLEVQRGRQCLFFASEVVRMDVTELDDENLRITQIV